MDYWFECEECGKKVKPWDAYFDDNDRLLCIECMQLHKKRRRHDLQD